MSNNKPKSVSPIAERAHAAFVKRQDKFIKLIIDKFIKPEDRHHFHDGDFNKLTLQDKCWFKANVELFICQSKQQLRVRIYDKAYGDDGYIYRLEVGKIVRTGEKWS